MKAQGETQEQEACDDGSLAGSQHAQLAIVPGKARKVLLHRSLYRNY